MLSILGPLVVVAGSLRACTTFETRATATEARNAGRILNGKVADRNTAEVIERVLQQRSPELLVLGPSYANTNVNPHILSERLGVPADRIVLLSVPNSVGAHWYAMLKYRLFERGRIPRAIVIVSGLQSMLLAAPLSEASFVNLQVQLPPEGDPVVADKAQIDTTIEWARLRAQRGKIRAALFDGLRDRSVAFLVPGRHGRLTGPGETRAALDEVFADARVDMRLHDQALPVADVQRGNEVSYSPDMLPTPEGSFLREITALCRDAGSRAVWVRPPMSPNIPPERDDVAPDGFQERAIGIVEAEGGAYVDMRGLPMSGAMFKNIDHMNREGSRRFTEALASTLLELEAKEVADRGELRLLGRTVVEAGVLVDRSVRPTYIASPAPVPAADRAVIDQPGPVAAYDTRSWAFLSDDALVGQNAFLARCSPLLITEDGVPLPRPNVPCQEVTSRGRGRTCHTTDRILFTAPDGSDPATNGRSYRLVLDPERSCHGAAWIYPIDMLSLEVPPEELRRLAGGARWLQIEAEYLNYRESGLRMRVVADGRTVLDETRDGRRWKDGPAVFPLDPPPLPGAEVRIEIENHGHVFYLLTGVSLSEERHYDLAASPSPPSGRRSAPR